MHQSYIRFQKSVSFSGISCLYMLFVLDIKKLSFMFSLQLVNIGSGVSILAVYGPNNFKRVTGTR